MRRKIKVSCIIAIFFLIVGCESTDNPISLEVLDYRNGACRMIEFVARSEYGIEYIYFDYDIIVDGRNYVGESSNEFSNRSETEQSVKECLNDANDWQKVIYHVKASDFAGNVDEAYFELIVK